MRRMAEPTASLIVLKGLEGNAPAALVSMQKAMLPHLSTIEYIWWVLWWAVLVYMFVNHVLVPLSVNRKNKPPYKRGTPES